MVLFFHLKEKYGLGFKEVVVPQDKYDEMNRPDSGSKDRLMREKIPFELKDIPDPNLFRDYFPYTEVPKLPFSDRLVPRELPDDIFITDTTFRDGQQSRPPYTAEQIATIYDFLHRMSGPNGVIRQTEFFLYSDKDKEAVRLCLERGYRFPEVTGWIRANKKDFQLVKDMGLIGPIARAAGVRAGALPAAACAARGAWPGPPVVRSAWHGRPAGPGRVRRAASGAGGRQPAGPEVKRP